ncbi:MAG TPA: hypothetical protein VFW85_07875 [Gaiellaceae bacterium]|nr:hypothetical protein [Gaiellaceae bacterium]
MKTTDMTKKTAAHDHVISHVHVVMQERGVPFEVEQDVCTVCHAVLAARPLKRADG